jgi:four helix bundle protein
VLYQFYLSWHKLLLKFPKAERYTLGANCEQQILTAIEAVMTAAAISNKETKLQWLRKASAKLDLLRLLIRLSKDCECLSNQAYLQLESELHEAGKMLGGWIKSLS